MSWLKLLPGSNDPAPSLQPVGQPSILLTGFLNSPLGLGQVGRALVRALSHQGVNFEAYDLPLGHLEAIGTVPPIQPDLGAHLTLCLCSINGEHFPRLAQIVGNDFFQQRYIIGVWFWETPELPEAACKGLPYVDEIWTCSEFTANSIRNAAADKIVRVFPYPITAEDRQPPSQSDLGPPFPYIHPDAFVYLFAFDFHSCVERKNPDGVCQAFSLAFPNPDPAKAVCVIKSSNGDQFPLKLQKLRSKYAHRPDILFFDGFLPSSAMKSLVHRANCYVSLHRAEGFGLTLLEALACEKPCIASAYSGNLTFMSPENSWLIPVRMQEVGPDSHQYPAHHIWAEPVPGLAAEAMRECLAGGPAVRERVISARRRVEEVYFLENASKGILTLLREAGARKPNPKKLPSAKPYSLRAKEKLAQLQELESTLPEMKGRPRLGEIVGFLRLLGKLVRENRKASELILKASREREKELLERIATLEKDLHDNQRQLAELLAEVRSTI